MAINYLELIDNMTFPATRAEIVDYAQRHGGSEEAVEAFRAMPREYFESLNEVSKFIGRLDQLPGGGVNNTSSAADTVQGQIE